MGLGTTVKNMLSSNSQDDVNSTKTETTPTKSAHGRGQSDASGYSRASDSSYEPISDDEKLPYENNSGSKLRSGTGVGTTGKGGELGIGGTGHVAPDRPQPHRADDGKEAVGGTRTGDFTDPHRHGHNKLADKIMPSESATQDTNQLEHVTHENVHHHETEEVTRQVEHDRHVHHVKHHVQPIKHVEDRDEVHHDKVHPVTQVREKHASKDEDTQVLDGQVRQHRDQTVHAPVQRTVVDKGTIVHENVHHHVHHVVQPIIEKTTHDNHRIHTVIPSHEVTHEAPVIHDSEAHAPVSMDTFLKSGGALSGGVKHASIKDKVLHGGDCNREVDGVGEKLARELKLGQAAPGDKEHAGYLDKREGVHRGLDGRVGMEHGGVNGGGVNGGVANAGGAGRAL